MIGGGGVSILIIGLQFNPNRGSRREESLLKRIWFDGDGCVIVVGLMLKLLSFFLK